MIRVGVVLSGCGVYDGSEVHEAVLSLLAIAKAGAEAVCMAPDMEQMHVINHFSGQTEAGQSRNVLVESARIARGQILDIATVSANDIDALVIPGGYGAAKNLCDFAVAGADCTVNIQVQRLIEEMLAAGKPLAGICIAPAILAKILGKQQPPVTLTIGTDQDTAAALDTMGVQHVACPVDEVVVDKQRKIVTTPAYMLADNIAQVAVGIEKAIQRMLKLR
ncbi:MAG: isoprenoid biosynthesis protein ElbB [Desulfuromonadales bacterium C00003094]|jgi:enhancing lycopene biosynthesis protein 2|nr:MAG: isoprenoid biosynthesis protein ElbB [Desulfuromonadales bacterium C00003094]OEU72600.1 MAG: isoprenoid biosynthesis protein ElbB [Desulfuromonadales bacterium C00003107]